MSSSPETLAERNAGPTTGTASFSTMPRQFVFERDSFAFANELLWEYAFDAATGQTRFSPRQPKPNYTHRCFVLTRAARQFFNHAHFAPDQAAVSVEKYQALIREALGREPHKASMAAQQIVFPGYSGLRDFSHVHENLLKAECGGAWRSYVLRSHWRMVFPITRQHQTRMVTQLTESIHEHGSAIVHLFRFPALTINHGMILFNAMKTGDGVSFEAYDPNEPAKATVLSFDRVAQTFTLPATRYWPGGKLDALEIYRTWWF